MKNITLSFLVISMASSLSLAGNKIRHSQSAILSEVLINQVLERGLLNGANDPTEAYRTDLKIALQGNDRGVRKVNIVKAQCTRALKADECAISVVGSTTEEPRYSYDVVTQANQGKVVSVEITNFKVGF